MALSRIRQEDEEEEARRRRRYPEPAPPPPDGNGNGVEASGIAPYAPTRHRHGEHFCYCPSSDCGYQMSVEEGQKCNLIECPLCGTRMRAVSTGEYRISQAEPVPVAPLLVTFGLLGLLAYAMAKRPFG